MNGHSPSPLGNNHLYLAGGRDSPPSSHLADSPAAVSVLFVLEFSIQRNGYLVLWFSFFHSFLFPTFSFLLSPKRGGNITHTRKLLTFKLVTHRLKSSTGKWKILVVEADRHTHTHAHRSRQARQGGMEALSLSHNHRASLSSGPSTRKRNKSNSSYYRLLDTK